MNRAGMVTLLLLITTFAVVGWAGDVVTLQGEHTIYTVRCENGTWDGPRCSGRLAAGERYRFRALKARGEVLFWLAGSAEPSGKFTGCTIADGRNWSCPPNVDAARSITLALSRGRAQRDASGVTRPFNAIQKWKWWCLNAHIASFARASY